MPGGLTRVAASPDRADDLQPARGHQQGHLGGVGRAGPAAERLAAVGPDHGPTAGGARHRHPAARAGGRPAVRPRPHRRARRAGHPSHPDRADPARPAARAGRGRGGRIPPGPALGARGRVGLRPGVRARRGGRPGPTARTRSARRRRGVPAGPPAPSGVPSSHRPGTSGPTRPAPDPELPTDRRALALVLDAGVDGSLVSSLGLLVDAAYSVREQLSSDTWQLVGDVEEEVARLRNRPPTQLVGVQSSLQRLLQALLGPVGAVGREHGAGLGLAVPRRRTAARAGPVPGAAGPRRAGPPAGRRWSRTCWSSRCSRPPTA